MKVLKSAFPLALLFFASSAFSLPVKTLTITCDTGEVKVKAEMAIREEEKAHGFMGRKDIPAGTGMLFVYDHDIIMHFWMKDTPHPLSIAFITKEGVIKDIFNMTPFTLRNYDSSGYCRYALEVPQGWFKSAGVKTGDTLTIDFL